ncbi:MAG: hypothetical protein H6577_04855 [Lewinellaceae bacterium]|nr:hypothetical protein [Lewinellaceae bacterium]
MPLPKFSFNIRGDTANMAARMESSGKAGKVNASQTSYSIEKGRFTCSHRGNIDAKNKGCIDMYFAEGNSDG